MNGIDLAIAIVKPIVIFAMVVALMCFVIWMERKGAAYIQDRRGPNRASILGLRLGGLMHVLADTIKLFTKEEVAPEGSDRMFFILSPVIAFTVVVSAAAVIPFAPPFELVGREFSLQVASLGSGLVFAVAMTSLGVYAVILAGWCSRGTYSFLGGMRQAAQFISYELALGLSIVAVFLVAGSLDVGEIVADQGIDLIRWNAIRQPVAFLIFFTAMFAESNRLPFDLCESDSEIVGYHVEYSSMRFAMFFMAEYAHIVIASAIAAAIFFGGWNIPFVRPELLGSFAWIVGLAVMLAKTLILCAVFIWVRWTIPRFRYDRMMAFGWKVLLPLALANVAITAFAVMRLTV